MTRSDESGSGSGAAQGSMEVRVLLGPPKEFGLGSCSVPKPTVCEPRAGPGGTAKADLLSRPEFAFPLASGSHLPAVSEPTP